MTFNVEDQSEDSLKCFPTLPRLQYAASDYQPCWFVSVIRHIHQYMKVVILAEFNPFVFAPSEMMVTVNSGKCSYIVEVENEQLTKGWYTVALNHKLGKNYTMLFASIRRHVFELFIFDEEGSRVRHELINNGLDSKVHDSVAAIMNVDELSFQASSSEHQFWRTLRKAYLKEMNTREKNSATITTPPKVQEIERLQSLQQEHNDAFERTVSLNIPHAVTSPKEEEHSTSKEESIECQDSEPSEIESRIKSQSDGGRTNWNFVVENLIKKNEPGELQMEKDAVASR